jgi:hypothetical protein
VHFDVAFRQGENEETPRNGVAGMLGEQERELDREFLEGLRCIGSSDLSH